MKKTAVLPTRCTRCNAPTDRRLKCQLSWHSPFWFLLILAGLLIYIIAALLVRETATIHVGCCDLHRRKRLRGIAIGWLLFLAGVGLMILGFNQRDSTPFVLLGASGLLGGLIYVVVALQFVRPKRIDKNYVWLKKVCPDYLAELPNWDDYVSGGRKV